MNIHHMPCVIIFHRDVLAQLFIQPQVIKSIFGCEVGRSKIVIFWRASGDRLFAMFAWAFWLLAASWTLLGMTNPTDETRPYIYAVRLVAFLLIIAAIVEKNRRP